MVAALWSNSNWDDDKGSRKKAVDDLNSSHAEAIEAVELAMSTHTVREEEKLDSDNPFFAAAERGLSRIETEYGKKTKPKEEEVDFMKGLDQN